MNNKVIDKDGEQLIGYSQDLGLFIKELAREYLNNNNWEELQELCELEIELNAWADNNNLLVIDSCNGMGYTIKEYTKG